jgi:hypothetical protein
MPVFPPTEKTDMPVAFRGPVKKEAVLNPSGWYEAMPRPLMVTSRRIIAKLEVVARSAKPAPARKVPSGRRKPFSFLSERKPKSGCMIDDVRLAMIRITPAMV